MTSGVSSYKNSPDPPSSSANAWDERCAKKMQMCTMGRNDRSGFEPAPALGRTILRGLLLSRRDAFAPKTNSLFFYSSVLQLMAWMVLSSRRSSRDRLSSSFCSAFTLIVLMMRISEPRARCAVVLA